MILDGQHLISVTTNYLPINDFKPSWFWSYNYSNYLHTISQILKHIQKRNHFNKLDIAHTSNYGFTSMLSQNQFLDRPYGLFKPVNFFFIIMNPKILDNTVLTKPTKYLR